MKPVHKCHGTTVPNHITVFIRVRQNAILLNARLALVIGGVHKYADAASKRWAPLVIETAGTSSWLRPTVAGSIQFGLQTKLVSATSTN